MVKNVSAVAGTGYFDLVWIAPKVLPMSYKINVFCFLMPNGVMYRSKGYNASSVDTKLRVNDLYFGSRCAYNLIAIYNPASRDYGITDAVVMPIASKQSAYHKFCYMCIFEGMRTKLT